MNTSLLIVGILFCIVILVIAFFIVNPYLTRKNVILERNTKNKLYELYTHIDPVIIRKSLDDMIDSYIAEYYFYKVKNKDYLSNGDAQNMIRVVTDAIYIDLSELYLFYIKLIQSVETDEDLLKFINTRVKERVLVFAANQNKTT